MLTIAFKDIFESLTTPQEKIMEIRVVATVIVKPEFLSEVTEALHEVIEPSR